MMMPHHHFNAMRWFIEEMEELYLIGWKGNEVAFNRILAHHAGRLRRIVIVNPNMDEVVANLGKTMNLARYEITDGLDFEKFVLEGMSGFLHN
jgi:hypothetical protein